MVTKCTPDSPSCYSSSWAEASKADRLRNPSIPHEYMLSALDRARAAVDRYVQSHDLKTYPVQNIGARAVALHLAFHSVPLETGLSLVGDTAPALHAVATSIANNKITAGFVAMQVIVGVGDMVVESATTFPNMCMEVAVGNEPASAINAWGHKALGVGMIFQAGAGLVKAGLSAIKSLATMRAVVKGAADAVNSGAMGGGMGLATSAGVFVNGRAVAATIAAAGMWPSGLESIGGALAAISQASSLEASGGAIAPSDSLKVAAQEEFDAKLARLDSEIKIAKHDYQKALDDSMLFGIEPEPGDLLSRAHKYLFEVRGERADFLRANPGFAQQAGLRIPK